MMRICLYNLTSGFKAGGLETFTWGLGEALGAAGHEVQIVAGEGGRTSPTEKVKLVQFPYTPRERFPNLGTRFRKLAERLSFARHALPYLRRQAFDVVMVNKPYDFFVLHRLKRTGFQGVTCYNSGGTEFFAGDRWLAKAVDVWLPCSEYNAGKVSAHYGRPFVVLNNGVDTARFSPRGKPIDLRNRFHLPDTAQLVMSVGRLIGSKGNHVVLEAIRSLPRFHFFIVGGGPERARLEALAATYGVQDRVHLLGEIPHAELPGYLRGADIFVQPSIGEEAFGISVAEAMACGLPVLASAAWGLREVVVDSVTGVLVPPGAADGWRDALRQLGEGPEVMARMGVAARERVVERFTWQAAARTFEAAVANYRGQA